MDPKRILVLNPGSSSLKAALIEPPGRTMDQAEVAWGADASRHADRQAGLTEVAAAMGIDLVASPPDAVGYRVVHGGTRFTGPTLIDADVLEGIRSVAELAPLHNAVALETIEAGRRSLPEGAHVACFDTAFHASLEAEAYRYPVPEHWYAEWGVRRYGFHGLSVEWSVRRASELLGRERGELDVVVAHLGSGCSVTAVRGGRSVDTSMGLTPLEGLMMGTRSGSIDPGALLHLLGRDRITLEQVGEALDHDSGLLGVSGSSSDMRELEAAAGAGDERARLAISMFVRRAAAGIAAVATSLDRIDALVFTGGIGENAETVRRRIVGRLKTVGIRPLPDKGPADDDARIDDAAGATAVLKVVAREDLVIAEATAALLSDR